MRAGTAEATAIVLAGGAATRFPGKLERGDGGEPLVVRAHDAFAGAFPVIVSANATFGAEIDARLTAPIVADRWPGRGPLGGILSALALARTPWIFVVAADLPRADAALALELLAAARPGDEAVLPEHAGGIEPLCALYDRAAFERAGLRELREGGAAVRDVVARLRARRVPMAAGRFTNINTRDDWSRAFASHGSPS